MYKDKMKYQEVFHNAGATRSIRIALVEEQRVTHSPTQITHTLCRPTDQINIKYIKNMTKNTII